MPQFLPGTDFICSGYANQPNYDNMFAGSNWDAHDFDDWCVIQRDMKVDAGLRPVKEEEVVKARNYAARAIQGLFRELGLPPITDEEVEAATYADGSLDVEDVMTISGRGTVATGRVERGELKLNDQVEIVGIKETQTSVATGIEMFRKTMDFCEAGDNVGILLRGIKREDIERGQVLCKPGSVTPHKKFTGEVYVLTKEEGGRHTPFFAGYRPQFYFRTTDITGDVQELTDSNGTKVEMAMPGDHITVTCELIHPIALEQGLKFAIREGGHTVGDGRVTSIIE